MARTYTNTPEPRYVEKAKETESIPQVSSDDNGKFLGVVDGKFQVASIPAVPVAEAVADATDADDVVQTVNAVISALVNAGLMDEYVPPLEVAVTFEASKFPGFTPLEPSETKSYTVGSHIPEADVNAYIASVIAENEHYTFQTWLGDTPVDYEVKESDISKVFTASFLYNNPQ